MPNKPSRPPVKSRGVRLAIRGYAGKVVKFEDHVEVDMIAVGRLLPALARKHAQAMVAHELHMIEIEFLDEPNQNERFFRFGTDPSGMVVPLAIDLRKGMPDITKVWPTKLQ